MNETIKNLLLRRVCHSYREEQIKDLQLEQIIHAGLAAACPPYDEFVILVCQKSEIIKRLICECNITCGFYGAPTLIFLFTQKEGSLYFHDYLAVAENMAVAADRLGLGSCYISGSSKLFKSVVGMEIQTQCKIEKTFTARICMCFGYPQQKALDHNSRGMSCIRRI